MCGPVLYSLLSLRLEQRRTIQRQAKTFQAGLWLADTSNFLPLYLLNVTHSELERDYNGVEVLRPTSLSFHARQCLY
jgi:hypothetical protein